MGVRRLSCNSILAVVRMVERGFGVSRGGGGGGGHISRESFRLFCLRSVQKPLDKITTTRYYQDYQNTHSEGE